jgi:glycosyltransferase involved in cell wall biosynthesis
MEDRTATIQISIIMLTYQRASLVRESINSVIQQSFQAFELLILDDGSVDDTRAIIGSINDPRIKYFYLEHSGKIAALRNIGIQKAQGEYIAFLDSDDLWEKDKLEKQYSILQTHPEVGFTFSDVEEFNANGFSRKGIYNSLPQGQSFYKGSIFDLMITNRIAVYPSSLLFRKTCLAQTGLMDERLHPGETNFIIRLSALFEAYILFECSTKIRKHPENISILLPEAAADEMIQTVRHFYKTGKIDQKKYNASLLSLQYDLAMTYWRGAEFRACRKMLLQCLKINPLFIKAYMRYILSWFKTNKK